MSESRCRLLLCVLAVGSALFVVYASLVPLQYEPVSWAESWKRFWQIPWFELGLDKRADWFANGLVMIPFGFFFTAACCWNSRNVFWQLFIALLFLILQALLVCAIEFVQIWFPPRVLSWNDVLAGYIGGVSGMILWHLAGERMIAWIRRFATSKPGIARIAMLASACAGGLILYGLLPFDVMLSPDEWAWKRSMNRLVLLPFSDWQGLEHGIKAMLLGAWAFPLGIVLAQYHSRMTAWIHICLWCVAVELASLPIFSRVTSATDIIVSILAGTAGVMLSAFIVQTISRLDTTISWLIASILWTGVILVGFTIRSERVVTDSEEWCDRLVGILQFPFARAQRSTEFEAFENILVKVLVFALLAFLVYGWQNRRSAGTEKSMRTTSSSRNVFQDLPVTIVWTLLVGLLVEFFQVYLFPLVPDVTDLILYGIGSMVGVIAFAVLVPNAGGNS